MNAKSSRITLLLLLIAGISIFLLPSCQKLKEAKRFLKTQEPDLAENGRQYGYKFKR